MKTKYSHDSKTQSFWLATLLGGCALTMAACGGSETDDAAGNENRCVEGTTEPCSCDDGRPGTKTCVEQGKDFTQCMCAAPSGANTRGSIRSGGGGSLVREDKLRIQVLKVGGGVVANATVVANGDRRLGVTDARGRLDVAFSDARASALTVSAPGFVDNVQALQSAGTTDVFVAARLMPVGTSAVVDPAAPIAVQHVGAEVAIPANSLVDENGNKPSGAVTVDFTFVGPSGDLDAVGTFGIPASSDEILQSLGVGVVRARSSSGAPLKLAAGQLATLRIPADTGGQTVNAPPPPLWQQNTGAGGWDKAGASAWTQQGDAWVAQVDALATWNCDYPTKVTCMRGSLVAPNDKPLSGVVVTGVISGQAASFLPTRTVQKATTGSAGTYCMEVVPNANVALSVICPGGKTVPLGTLTGPNMPGARCSGASCADAGSMKACCVRDSDCNTDDGERCVQGACQSSLCNENQTAGGDTPESRIVDLGKSAGTITFGYDAVSIKDHFVVTYEGKVLHDTGCVSGGSTLDLAFSGKDTFVTVDVIPNCDGDSGTSWSFNLTCPK